MRAKSVADASIERRKQWLASLSPQERGGMSLLATVTERLEREGIAHAAIGAMAGSTRP